MTVVCSQTEGVTLFSGYLCIIIGSNQLSLITFYIVCVCVSVCMSPFS